MIVWKKLRQKLTKLKSVRLKSLRTINTQKGVIVNNQKDIANKFNVCCINTAKKLIKKIEKANNKFQDFLKNPNEHIFFIKETGPDEVLKLVKDLNTNKSADIIAYYQN